MEWHQVENSAKDPLAVGMNPRAGVVDAECSARERRRPEAVRPGLPMLKSGKTTGKRGFQGRIPHSFSEPLNL